MCPAAFWTTCIANSRPEVYSLAESSYALVRLDLYRGPVAVIACTGTPLTAVIFIEDVTFPNDIAREAKCEQWVSGFK